MNIILRITASTILFVFTNNSFSCTIGPFGEYPLFLTATDTIIDNQEKEELKFVEPESPPQFKDGGEFGMHQFIQENLHRLPTDTVKGIVYVSVVVDTIGNGKDIKILKGLSPSTNAEALRIVSKMNFIPGKVNGLHKEMTLRIPVKFE